MTAHCPYLAPSLARGLTGWTVYEAAGETDAVEAELFWAGVQAAEWIRPLAQRPHGALVCENVVILGGALHSHLTAWPHWALKNLYGPVGVMFGKFHAGEEEFNRDGQSIPTTPVSFLPVRPAVRKRDPRFLRDTPDLADALAVAVDDGRDVFGGIPHQLPLTAAIDLCRTVAEFHASGWVHSDLQPTHGIHAIDGVRLIDFAWAWPVGKQRPPGFEGTMIHLTAPELATCINDGEPVIPDVSADVYALAGALWTCITGRWPLDYAAAGATPGTLTTAELRVLIANRRAPLDEATPWPELQGVLRPVLLAGNRDRPTAGELADLISKVAA
ncbi:hypothetical protein [Streptomyces spiramyceticus]|uniref:hypothetical protein n=1 Tax=Streptomyces spiramyceticus TaxID=299717 RepID=UPI00237C25BD|nr:hypothetical protein [Streptomyces spiramyceticus]